MHQDSMRTIFSRPGLVLLTIAAALLIGGCKPQNQSDDENRVESDIAQQAETESALFIELDSAPQDELQTIESGTEQLNAGKSDPGESNVDGSNIVAQTGFSGIEDETRYPAVSREPEFFCLNGVAEPDTDADTDKECEQISDRLASVTMKGCSKARLAPTGCNSVTGFPILVREFPPLGDREPQGRILIVGGTHGDELTSVSVTFRWIEKLNRYHSGLFHWRVAPMMNPDGVLKREATRTNQNGVDLNRNMPSTDWMTNALAYWENKSGKDPRKYPGTQAASEPETRWLIDEINSFKPDAIIAIHAPYGVVDFDSLLLSKAPRNLGKLHLNLLGTYPGSLGNYAGINRDIPVITLELPHAWEMPSENDTTKIWEDIVSWLKKNVHSPEKIASAE